MRAKESAASRDKEKPKRLRAPIAVKRLLRSALGYPSYHVFSASCQHVSVRLGLVRAGTACSVRAEDSPTFFVQARLDTGVCHDASSASTSHEHVRFPIPSSSSVLAYPSQRWFVRRSCEDPVSPIATKGCHRQFPDQVGVRIPAPRPRTLWRAVLIREAFTSSLLIVPNGSVIHQLRGRTRRVAARVPGGSIQDQLRSSLALARFRPG